MSLPEPRDWHTQKPPRRQAAWLRSAGSSAQTRDGLTLCWARAEDRALCPWDQPLAPALGSCPPFPAAGPSVLSQEREVGGGWNVPGTTTACGWPPHHLRGEPESHFHELRGPWYMDGTAPVTSDLTGGLGFWSLGLKPAGRPGCQLAFSLSGPLSAPMKMGSL